MVELKRDTASGLYLRDPSDRFFFVFADAAVLDAKVDVGKELAALRGFFLFVAAIPGTDAEKKMLEIEARTEMLRIPPARIGWLDRASGAGRIGFALFLEKGASGVRTAPEQIGLEYRQNFEFALRESLAVSWNDGQAQFEIDNSRKRCSLVGSGAAVKTLGATVALAAFGGDAGRFAVDAVLDDDGLSAFDAGLRIFERIDKPVPRIASLRFPVFDAGPRTLELRAVLDPLDVTTPKSDAGLNGTSLRFSGAAALTTHYRTAAGHPLQLTPANRARFELIDIVESLGSNPRKCYLAPAGDFVVASGGQLLAGTAGTEYLAVADTHLVRFVPGMPALQAKSATAGGPFLEPGAWTSWIELAPATATTYVGEPEDAPLYGSPNGAVFAGAPPIFAFLEHEKRQLPVGAPAMPVLPFGGVDAGDVATALRLESDLVSRQRRLVAAAAPLLIGATKAAAQATTAPTYAMTPHGLIRRFDASGTEDLLIARDPSQAQVEFQKLEAKFREAVGRSRLLLVISRNGGAFGSFVSKTKVAKWEFDLKVALGAGGGALSDQAIVIMKFDDRPLFELIKRPELWAEPATFNADSDKVLQHLIGYLQPIADGHKPEHERLRDALKRASWNGILAINAEFKVPDEAKCLASGLPPIVRAHHIALEINDVDAAAGIELRASSSFALIDYQATFTPPADPSQLYDFKVTKLQVLFENSKITDFQCESVLFARTLFDDALKAPTTFVIKGHYENHDGKETYSFLNDQVHELKIDSPIVDSVTVTRVALITVDPGSTEVVSQFLLTGTIAFEDLSGAIGLDFFSFEALHFDRTGLEMRVKPGENPPRISFNAGDIGIDVKLNDLRGLMKYFPLKLKRFRRLLPDIPLPDLVPLFGSLSGCAGPRYALHFEIDLGSFGGLASGKDFKAEVVLAWCGKLVFGGIRLPESKGGPKSIGLEGVISILVDHFEFFHFAPDVYALALRGCAIEVLGTRFPSGQRPDIYVFVDPKKLSDGQNAGVGWLLSVPSADIGPFQVERFVLGQRVGPPLNAVRTVSEALVALTDLPKTDETIDHDFFANRLAGLYQPNRGWLIGSVLHISDRLTFGFVFNDPVLYGALLKIGPPANFAVEITYRKITEDIGVYHLEITLPESIRQWEFGAVSITIPTVGVSIFTNGNFVLDVGYPYDFNFSRSCTIQALPFIGSGGFYYGSLGPQTSSALTEPGLQTVVELGFGARIGLGKEFEKGILRAGLTVSVYGFLEGALGYKKGANWNEPSEYLVRGRVGVIGQLYGYVNFGIVKAGFGLTLIVGIGIELGSQVDTVLWIEGQVAVEIVVVIGTIRIWRITIEIKVRFSFTTQVRFQWVLESKRSKALRAAAPLALAAASGPLSWALPPAPGHRPPLKLYFIPEVTVRDGVGQFVGGLVITAPADDQDAQTDFDRLVDELVRWAVWRHFDDGVADPEVTQENLLALDRRLHLPKTLARTKEVASANVPLDYDTLASFLRQTFDVTIDGVSDHQKLVASFFPIDPESTLILSVDGTAVDRRDLWTISPRDEKYQDVLTQYFHELTLNIDPPSVSAAANLKPMTAIVFEDYFDFITKAAVDRLWRKMVDDGIDKERLAALLTKTRFDELAGMAGRFFKQGLRVPADTTTKTTEALYQLMGVQIPAPKRAAVMNELKVALELRAVATPWVSLGAVAPEVVLEDKDDFYDEIENAKVEPVLTVGESLPVRLDQRRFAIQRWAQWDSNGTKRLLWQMPRALDAVLRSLDEVKVELFVGSSEHPFKDDKPVAIVSHVWATRIDLTVRRAVRRDGTQLDNVFEIGGATERNRHFLDDLLTTIDPAQLPKIELLIADGDGLKSEAVDPAKVLLIRGNYSTETTPPPETLPLAKAAAAATAATSDRAAMTEPVEFLRLAQECSLVNTGGYFLSYGDAKLPDGALGAKGDSAAVVSLVITEAAADNARVRRYHNALAIDRTGAIADAAEPSKRVVFYARAATLLEPVTLIEPGCVGFEITRPNPESGAPTMSRELEILYNLLDYKVPAQSGFRASIDSLPLTPVADVEGDALWHYRQVVPLRELATSTGLYSSVGKTAAIDFDVRDCFGNQLRRPVRHPFKVCYFDKLVALGAWPGVSSSYRVVRDGLNAKILVDLDFDPRQFVGQTADGKKDVAARARRISEQITDANVSLGIRSSLRPSDDLALTAQQRKALATLLEEIARFVESGGSQPAPVQVGLPVTKTQTLEAFFELTVTLAIERKDAALIHPAAADDPEVRSALTVISPAAEGGALTAASLRQFAEELEAAIPAMRVAVGTSAAGGAGVWVVRIGARGAIDVEVDAKNVRFYAVPPITTDRIPGDGDFDVIGRRFLEAIDWFVGQELAPRVLALHPQSFDSVAERKRELAGAIADQLTPLLAKHDPAGDDLIAGAREALRQKLLIALETAYKVDVVVAFPCKVTSPLAGGDTGPKLFGSIDAKPGGGALPVPLGLTSAKLDVGTAGTGTRPLAFLVDVFTERNVSSLDVDLSYVVTNLEYFAPTKERDRFSRWLKFVNPGNAVPLGATRIPVPLRQYPLAPRIAHTAIPDGKPSSPSPVMRARAWTYDVQYEADNAAQDTVTLEIELNVQARAAKALQAGESLLDLLTEFDRRYPVMQAELRRLAAGKTADVNQVKDFVLLAERVTTAWRSHVPTSRALRTLMAGDADDLRYELQEERPQDDRIVAKVTRAESRMPFPDTMRVAKWRLSTRQVKNDTVTFTFAPDGTPTATRERALVFTPFDVLREESAWSSVKLSRNASLGGEAAREQFVYRTPMVRASEPIVVLRSEETPIDVTALGGGASAPLLTHLEAMFSAIFELVPQGTRRAKVETRFAFDLRGGAINGLNPVVPRVPIQLTAPFEFGLRPMTYLSALEDVLATWLKDNAASPKGSLIFDISVFAFAAEVSLPVLRLRNLQLPLGAVKT